MHLRIDRTEVEHRQVLPEKMADEVAEAPGVMESTPSSDEEQHLLRKSTGTPILAKMMEKDVQLQLLAIYEDQLRDITMKSSQTEVLLGTLETVKEQLGHIMMKSSQLHEPVSARQHTSRTKENQKQSEKKLVFQ